MKETLPAGQRVRVGEYRLLEELGRGGMGVVYRAEGPAGQVALKVLVEGAPDGLAERLMREGEARVDHPNVVRVMDAGGSGHEAYIAFEYLEGMTLEERLAGASLSPEETATLGIQLCAGLQAIHDAGFVHRDIKSGNVFLCVDGRIKILDFGVALDQRSAGSRLTKAGMVLGTPAYLAPEQARGELDIGPQADIWSLGMILYECLTGTLPFERDTPLASLVAGLLEEVPSLEDLELEVPSGLVYVVEKALEKETRDRWPDARRMSDALAHVDFGEPEDATDVGPSHRLSTGSDENRVVAVLLAEALAEPRGMKDIVEKWGALFTPLAGQRGLAIFGYDAWEGDELERAAAAALAAGDCATKLSLCVRYGKRSGDGISGEVIDTAQRSLEFIDTGVVLDPQTAASLGAEHKLQSLPCGHVRLVEEAGGASVFASLFTVGRRDEIEWLEEGLREQGGCLRLLHGAAGLGRSHLLRRLRSTASQQGALVLTASCESHQRHASFSSIGKALRARALELAGQGSSALSALELLVDEAFGEEEISARSWAFLAELTDLGKEQTQSLFPAAAADPRVMLDNCRLALLDYFGALSRARKIVVLLDDAHLADRSSVDFLASLLSSEGGELAAILSARSDRMESLGELMSGTEGAAQLELLALDEDDSAKLAASIVDVELPERLLSELAERTRGNPLFIRQTALSLQRSIEGGESPSEIPLPISVEAAVQSQLDHLPSAEKEACKAMALFGGAFSAEEARRMVGAPSELHELVALVDKGIIIPGEKVGDEQRWCFECPTLSSVASRMLANSRRKQAHLRAAQILSGRRPTPFAEVAFHFEKAGVLPDAGNFYSLAVLRAAGQGSSSLVRRYAGQAIALGVPASKAFALHMAHASALAFEGEREAQREAIEHAIAAAASSADRARATIEMARWLYRGGEWEEARQHFDSGIETARGSGSHAVLAFALGWYSQTLAYRGEMEEARSYLREAMSLEVEAEQLALLADTRGQLAAIDGNLEERIRAFSEAAKRYDEIGDQRRAAGSEVNLSDAYNRLGSFDEAVHALREGLDKCRRLEHRLMEGYALANLGYALSSLGKLDEAKDILEEATLRAEKNQDHRLAAAVELYRARLARQRGRLAEASRRAQGAQSSAASLQMPTIEALSLALLSQLMLENGSASAALELAQQAQDIRERLGSIEEDEAELDLAMVMALSAGGEQAKADELGRAARERLEALAARLSEGAREAFLHQVPSTRALLAWTER